MMKINIEDWVISEAENHFKDAVHDFVVKEHFDIPFCNLTIEMILYDFLLIEVHLEKGSMFFSLVHSKILFKLLSFNLSDLDMSVAMRKLDEEVRLRIPDKYLIAKGW
ncbi:hypothetical protein [Vibrio nigripulchritudo]|uniref:hypothetical protein n=1 Tax=Vibrio nigripulchritudo TaxID=28173 RepID=UPI0003B18A97|nr:hypothetical protein [Vibrio nigripulchritudo]CCN72828.1 hypothetical protein VIBNISFn118_660080 [Vibrio nigripulchritudo SFn118]